MAVAVLGTRTSSDDPCLHGLIEAQARRAPHHPAVVLADDGTSLSYGELDGLANRCAAYLSGMGVGPGAIVAVLMERSLEMVVTLLGIMKAGAAYLPLDTELPAARLHFILADAGVSVVLTQERHSSLLADFAGAVKVVDDRSGMVDGSAPRATPWVGQSSDAAYVIYTSGSTGQPKGCLVSHRAIVNRLTWMQRAYRLSPDDRVLQKTPYTFDVSVWEFFWPLLAGATLIVAAPRGHKDSAYLVSLIRSQRITVCHFVPSMLRFFLGEPLASDCTTLRDVFVSGEALPYDLMQSFMRHMPARLHNLYGPTEAAVDVSYWACEAREDRKVPIGRAIDNIQLHILNESGLAVAPGEVGELHIAGVGLANGYLNRPELTAEKFIAHPFEPGQRMYRTGDLACELPDGEIEFLGRMDFQVKLRGLRIELGEIESVLRRMPSVKEAVVLVQDEHDDPKLVAYLEVHGDAPTATEVRRFVATQLPEYMVPNVVVPLAQLPVTTHGKLDRKALPWPVSSAEGGLLPPAHPAASGGDAARSGGAAPPFNELVQHIAGWMTRLLKRNDVAPDADLFDLGATSLTLVKVVQNIQTSFGVAIPVEVILDTPTVNRIANFVMAQSASSAPSLDEPVPAMRSQACPTPLVDVLAEPEPELALEATSFRPQAYLGARVGAGFAPPVAWLPALGRVLGGLCGAMRDGERKHMYASAGGLHAVRAYVAVMTDRVDGVPAGVYGHDPVAHALHRVSDGAHVVRSTLQRAGMSAQEGVALFLVAMLDRIAPTYGAVSNALVALEAGYMAQSLETDCAQAGLGLTPLPSLEFDAMADVFGLSPSDRFVHGLLLGASMARAMGSAPRLVSRTRIRHLDAEASVAMLMAGEQDVSTVSRQALPSPTELALAAAGVSLPSCAFDWDRYRVRACHRVFDAPQVSVSALSAWLSLMRSRVVDGAARTLYACPSMAQAGLQAFLFVREGALHGAAEGAYRYDEVRHKLVRVGDLSAATVERAYTPFNRKHVKQAGIVLLLVASPRLDAGDEDAVHQALLAAGALGQLFLERQAEFGLGMCPIGGMRFGLVRAAFGLPEQALLLHGFVAGSVACALPASYAPLLARDVASPDVSTRLMNLAHAPLAIVGHSGRYPGADDLAGFWAMLRSGCSAIEPLPSSRADLWGVDMASSSEAVRGAFLADIDAFDHGLFGITPVEARSLDPQERLLMQEAWACLDDAGYNVEALRQSHRRVGVYVGAMWNDYQSHGVLGWRQSGTVDEFTHHASLANRLSHVFDLRGPSVALNTSCASGLTALHFACESLRRGECDAALVAGVNIVAHPYHAHLLSGLGLLAPDGVPRPLSDEAQGWVMGEGVGALLLKPLDKALADRDHVHGVILGSALGHSGRTVRYGVPSAEQQAEGMRAALVQAGLVPGDIDLVEVAAPGAPLADGVEISAIRQVFGRTEGAPQDGVCHVGAIKGQIGHLESASALSQLAKVLAQFQHGELAPSVNTQPRSPLAEVSGAGVHIVDGLMPWPRREKQGQGQVVPRRALINALGAAGSSGHLVLQEHVEQARQPGVAVETVVMLSAASQGQLRELARRMATALARQPDLPLRDVAFTLRVGRQPLRFRLAVVVSCLDQLEQALRAHAQGQTVPQRLYLGQVDGEEVVQETVGGDVLDELARAWVRGAAVDSQALDQPAQGRVSLPPYPFDRSRHWLTPVASVHAPERERPMPAPTVSASTSTGLDTASSDALRQAVRQRIIELVGRLSGLPADKLGLDVRLEDIGLTSLMIQQLTADLSRVLGPVPVTWLFEHRDIRGLAEGLLRAHGPACVAWVGVGEATRPAPMLAVEPDLRGSLVRAVAPDEAIAVIGMAGRYPGARNLDELWSNLVQGGDAVTEIPAQRWPHARYFDGQRGVDGMTYSKWGGFLDDVDAFDPLFFNISPREAELLDPQERLFLQTAWHAMEDAGYGRESLRQAHEGMVGVFVGAMYSEYQVHPRFENGLSISTSPGTIANRVSYVLDLHGPSMTLDTMCSSSLTALHLAVESLRRGECRCAFAGGVNLSLHPNKYATHALMTMSSSDGRCRSFGAGGDGFVPAEGVGAVLLKPLSQALADGDPVHGLIRSTAINHGGRTNGFTVPDPRAHEALILAALRKGGVHPRAIGYVEAHGTGTALGDPIEIDGLTRAYRQHTQDRQFCAIGSVKSNIGHAESAAGMAGLAKVLLQMRHGLLVPSLHSDKPNPHIEFAQTPFVLQRTVAEWKRHRVEGADGRWEEAPRIAAISSFGAGGANGHVLVQEPPIEAKPASTLLGSPVLMVMSARDEDRLQAMAREWIAALDADRYQASDLPSMAYTLQMGRDAMAVRAAFVVQDLDGLRGKLQALAHGDAACPQLWLGDVRKSREMASLLSDDALAVTVQLWMARGRLDRLAEVWVQGGRIAWSGLYPQQGRMPRISLPCYPFAQQRFSVGAAMERPMAGPAHQTAAAEARQVLLQQTWTEAASVSLAGRSAEAPATVWVICAVEQQALAEALAQRLRSRGHEAKAWQADAVCLESFDGTGPKAWVDLRGLGAALSPVVEVLPALQRLIERGPRSSLRLLGVTRGLEGFGHAEPLALGGAVMAPLYRMLQDEYKGLRARHVDLDPTLALSDQVDCIVSELETDASEPHTCWRGARRHAPVLVPCHVSDDGAKLPAAAPLSFDPDEVVWITGGAGSLGLQCAMHVARHHGARRIVLSGRREMAMDVREALDGDEARRVMADLSALNVALRYESMPLHERDAVQACVDKVGAEWGPVSAVIHCAGALDRRTLAFVDKTPDSIAAVLAPKVEGLNHLLRALSAQRLKALLLFSSVASAMAPLGAGQSDYAMANGYMDHLACAMARQSARQVAGDAWPQVDRVLSLQWPNWRDSAMGEATTAAYKQSGLLTHDHAQGLALLSLALARQTGPVVLPALMKKGSASAWGKGGLSRSSQATVGASAPVASEAPQGGSATAHAPSLVGGLDMAVMQWLRALFARELKVSADQLELDVALQDYGVDSVMLARFTRLVAPAIGDEALDPSVLYEHSSVARFGQWLLAHHREAVQAFLAAVDPAHGGDAPETPVVAQPSAQYAEQAEPVAVAAPVSASLVGMDIAVVGMSCRFGAASDLPAYWALLQQARSAIKRVEQEGIKRWGHPSSYSAAMLDDIHSFDADFFHITREDAKVMDPQALMVLEEALRTFCDAGYEPQAIKGKRVGVYIGGRSQSLATFQDLHQAPNPILAVGQNYMAANVSRHFDLHGPSLVIDSACSSALSALHLAAQAIGQGDIDAALVGGVSLLQQEDTFRLFEQRRILNPDGEMHLFDRRAAGTVLGEGAGMVYVKPLAQAQADGDRIYAVIKGMAVNSDGRTAGPAAPNPVMLRSVMADALSRSGLQARDVTHIEANGSGSPVTDLLELKAIEAIYRDNENAMPCSLGSIKPHIGHPLCAEGMAGLIKLCLMLHHRKLLPFLSGQETMAHHDLAASGLYFQRETQPWLARQPVAALNCFADGGTNAHVLLGAWDEQTARVSRQALPVPRLVRRDVRARGQVASPGAEQVPSLGGLWLLRFENDHFAAG